MKRNYVLLSLIVSQALCADTQIADFGDFNTVNNPTETPLKPQSVTKNREDATYGTDWTGGTSYVNILSDQLDFIFSPSADLTIQDGFTFTNKITNPQTQTTISITRSNVKTPSNSKLILGQTEGKKITLGSNLNLQIKNFSDVSVVANLYVGANSTFDVSEVTNVVNDGGIVLEGKDSTLKVQNTLTNNGVILMRDSSKIESVSTLAINTTGTPPKQGLILVQGGATIASNGTTLTITNQDIKLQNLVSKDSTDSSKSVFSQATLTLSATSSGTLTLGDTSNGVVNIVGELSKTDTSITNLDGTSEIGNLVLNGFTTIDAKNINFKNVNVTSSSITSMTINSGKLGLENTTIAIGDFSAKASTTSNLSLGTTGTDPTITLTGQNTISATGTLTITGTYDFQGSGKLDLVGNNIILGNTSAFNAIGTDGTPTIGVSASNGITTNEFTLTNLTLQAISSKIVNTKMTLTNSTIEAIDSKENLVDLKIEGNNSGTITINNGSSSGVTFRGKNISIAGQQTITLQNSSTLTLRTEGGGVTLDGGTGTSISGTNGGTTGNLNLNTPNLTLKGKVTLNNLKVTANQDLQIVGTESDTSKGLIFGSGTTIDTGSNVTGGTQYHSLTFTSDFIKVDGATDEKQAYVSFGADTKLEASDFTFQNQNIKLNGTQNGTGLNLYAYGNEVSSGTSSGSGIFTFINTTFTDGSTSDLSLYSGSQGVVLTVSGLTLDGVGLNTYQINGSSTKTSLDLSSRNGVDELGIVALGGVNINASSFLSGFYDENEKSLQGISANINVGNSSKSGQLTITSDDTSDSFIFGGNLTLDNTKSGTTIKIVSNSKTASTNETTNELNLKFQGGGITAIGTSTNTVTLKAKDFTFSERLDSNGEVTASPFVKVQNTELELNGTSTALNLVGTLYLSGDTSNEAKFKATNGSTVTLTLHDVNAEGKASVTQNQLEFLDSNIYVGVLKDKGGNPTNTMGNLTIKDTTSSSSDKLIGGKIASITLEGGTLAFQQGSGSDSASITLNADSTITSSGTSSLILKTIKVGDGTTDLYSLNVTDGTFTLQENTAGNQLGAIALGTEDSQAGNGGNFVYKNGDASQYQSIDLKGNLTSYGDSSITANSFTISAKDADNNENYTISSTDGELKLIAQASSALTATANITLNNGSLGYYGSSNTLASLSLDSSSSISSVGTSTLQANTLDLKGASISASGGTLTLKGISSSTTAGDVVIGNAGVLTLQNTNTKLATLKIQDSKSLTLSADVGYITPSAPLGDGVFGQVNVQSLLFESKSGSLINIALNSSSSTSSYSDSLFALREGAVTLISTQDGIKKKSGNASYTDITLSDITSDTSGLTSITLTPYLEGGTDSKGDNISAQKLLLDLRVSQTNVTQLIESIKDSTLKESMTSIVNSGNNALILESIMQSDGNAFKVGMAEYISNGNVAVVQTALDYINGAMNSLSDSMFASNKIYELIAMLRAANVENRMVRAKNPFMAKTQLASLVKSLVGTAYASSDDSLLLEEESSTPNHGELWASFDGAMSFSQEESGNSSLYGFSAGYDTIVGEKKNFLLGFYASYGYGAYSVDYARNNSHNFGLGFYTRMSFENSEVDLILSQNVGLNHTDIDLGASNSYAAQMLKQTLAYNFYTTDIEARYGYVFKVGNEDSPYYFRPFGGINFALIVNSGARGDGAAELGIEAMNTYQLSVSVGVEMRKYFGEENYLYLLPILQKGLLNDGGGANVGFYGAENIKVTPAYNVDTSMAIYLGGQGSIGENLAVNGGVGVKLGFEKKDLLTNWNVGLRYKF